MKDSTTSEKALLGHVLWSPTDGAELLALVPASMFAGDGHATVAGVLLAMLEQGLPVDPTTVAARLDRSGTAYLFEPNAAVYCHDLMTAAPRSLDGARFHAEVIRRSYAARVLQVRSQQVSDALREGSAELDSATAELLVAVETAQAAQAELTPMVVRTARDLLAIDPPMRWRIPGLIGWREKIIYTGLEGLGKTELASQLAVCAAAGLHAFTGELHDPVRVLFVDCENELDALRRRFRRIVGAVELLADFDRDLLMVESIEAGMDITRPDTFARLRRQIDAARPDLLFLGPLYKLAVGHDLNKEENAVQITARLDVLRVEHDLAIITEAHPGKDKDSSGRRFPAPRGSSVFLGWPSVGFGLRPHESQHGVERPRVLELKQFRGMREDRPGWPTAVERQDGWPGHPVLPFAAWYEDGAPHLQVVR